MSTDFFYMELEITEKMMLHDYFLIRVENNNKMGYIAPFSLQLEKQTLILN